jgi:hypothetical protein
VSFPIHAVRSLKAAWQVICLDKQGFHGFAQDRDAFWTSFKAFFLVAPIYLYSSVMGARLSVPPVDEPSLSGSLALLALLWVLWPWMMLTISQMLGAERNYVRYVIAYNWTSVFIVAAIVPVLLLRQMGIAGPGLAALLSLAVIGWSLFMRWFVARHALEVNAPVAIALVAGDLALSIAGSLLI